MKNAPNNIISSTLKTVACENIVSEYELTQAIDKNLQDILNEQEQIEKAQNNQEKNISIQDQNTNQFPTK